MWPLDGGKYLGTGDAVVTQCPETGRVNVGTYRMMIKGPREVGVYTSPGKDATIDREKWWRMGKPMPIAACYGIDPLLFLVAATSLPKTECEYDYYSGINGTPIELFTGDVTGLPLPARAEIILEGFLYPDETFAEGPFGEFTGYYGRPSGATPYMRVEKVRYRDNPTLTCALWRTAPPTRRACSGPPCAPPAYGPTCRSSASPESRACGRFPRPPAGALPSSPSSKCMQVMHRR
jgi:4-hydroxy-3-polyprenylbenzoate decarboxylase